MNKLSVRHWDVQEDGELTEAAMQAHLESLGYRVSCYVYPPGTYFAPHTHAVDKIDAVLSGQFKMTLQGQSVILAAGDSLRVPKGEVHSAEVVGDESVISFDALKQ